MEFKQYLLSRHTILNNVRHINEKSASQYNNRLENMVKKSIYNGEEQIGDHIIEKINIAYAKKAGEYERTLIYFLEYRKYFGQK